MRPRPPRLRLQWFTKPMNSQTRAAIHTRRPLPNAYSLRKPLHQNQLRTIKAIQSPRPTRSRFNNDPHRPPLGATHAAAYQRRLDADTLPLRTGVLATKKGMTAVINPDSGVRRVVTVLQMDRAQVVGNKTREKHGYFAVCVGQGTRKPKNVGRAMMGQFAKSYVGEYLIGDREAKDATRKRWHQNRVSMDKDVEEEEEKDEDEGRDQDKQGIPPKRRIREFKIRDQSGLLPIGTGLSPDWFSVGQFVDTRSNTKGKGFAGVMKRWGFKGQPASHGVSLTHRSLGSVGGSQGSGSRVIPGKKMPGRMGNKRHTINNLEVLMVDSENGLILVGGPVSGPRGCLVMVQDALRKPWPDMSTKDQSSTQQESKPLQDAA